MALKGNKGEWSEIYTLFKLLGDGKVYAGDHYLNKIHNLFYPIVKILRNEKEGIFNYNLDNAFVVITNEEENELLRINAKEFLNKSELLLKYIKNGKGAFSLPDIENFLRKIFCSSLKAKSVDKTDIKIILHDNRTKLNSLMGYSIKSQLGSDSTLLNAGKSTNFTYKIDGVNFTADEIEKINNLNITNNKVIERFKQITDLGGKFIFFKVDNSIFNNNLIMLDGDLPSIIANMLLIQIKEGVSTIKDIVEYLNILNPLKYNIDLNPLFYTYKVKHLLTSVALGMMPATPWNGLYDANGGYLVVKKDGEILCYNFYDKNRFEDYLFSNAYLERASTTRHEYGNIFKLDTSYYFKLNFQVRIK